MMLKFLFIPFILGLVSCGFHPLYTNNISKELSQIELHNSNSILNFKINKALDKLLYLQNTSTESKYILEVNATCNYLDNIILFNSDIIEQIIVIKINYSLKDKKSNTIILEKTFNVTDSLNNSLELYTASINAEKSKNQLIDAAAKEIEQDLTLFFLRNNETISK